MTEIKKLQFSDGVSVVAPTLLTANVGNLGQYSSDAAYVTAKGSAAAEGDIYVSTSTDIIRIYVNSAWVDTSVSTTLSDRSVRIGDVSNNQVEIDTTLLGNVQAEYRSFDFVDGDVTTGTDTITEVAHGMSTRDTCYLTSTGTLPTGISASTKYYVYVTGVDTFKLAAVENHIDLGTFVDITAAVGGGTHTLVYGGLSIPSATSTTSGLVTNKSEGTWTPALRTSGTAFTGVTYTSERVGVYHRLGNLVTVSCNLVISAASGGTGSLQIEDLPFTSKNVSNSTWICVIESGNIDEPAGHHTVFGSMTGNSTTLRLRSSGDNTTLQSLAVAAATSGSYNKSFRFTLTYLAAD